MSNHLKKYRIRNGTKIDINDDEKSINHAAKLQFKKWLFEYFEELNSNQYSWHIEYIYWLELVKGWKHLGFGKFEKIPMIKDKRK
jgi:hypothetical protein